MFEAILQYSERLGPQLLNRDVLGGDKRLNRGTATRGVTRKGARVGADG